ncbi:MAG: hypothetical protein U0271_06895 [Polyangiaceae bacterium]
MPTFSLSEKTWWSLALGVVACSGPGSSDRSGPPATSTVVTTSPRATSVELACDGVRRTVSAEELTDRERARALLTELARALDRDPSPASST